MASIRESTCCARVQLFYDLDLLLNFPPRCPAGIVVLLDMLVRADLGD
jgi:hypothetical protein